MASIETVTLFVRDVASAKDFYQRAFAADVVFEDDESVVLRFGESLVNLLDVRAAGELVTPLEPGQHGAAPRSLFTVRVDNVDARCAELAEVGITMHNGPIDRPWGRRTAAFADPDGHVWELAHELP